MKNWAEAILEAVNYAGNEASLSDIYETLAKHFPLSEANRRTTTYGDRPAYQHEVRSFVSDLVKAGHLDHVGRGQYRLTNKGLSRLKAWLRADGRTLYKEEPPDAGPSKTYLVKVEMQPLEDGRYLAIASNLPGTHAEGETIAEALEILEDMARITIELCREKNLPLPAEFHGDASTPLIKAEVLIEVGA